MKSLVNTFLTVLLVLFLSACATQVVKTVANTEPAPSKEFVVSNFSNAQLEEGKALFEANCAKCHNLNDPESRDAKSWNKVLQRMLPKTKLAYEEGRLVQAYLISHSK